jgi:hypothetical protein
LNEERGSPLRAKRLARATECCVRREKEERAAARDAEEGADLVERAREERRVPRLRHPLRQVEHRLARVIERRFDHERLGGTEPQSLLEEVERAADRQRRRGQDARVQAIEELLLQETGDLDRRGLEDDVAAAARLGAIHVPGRVPAEHEVERLLRSPARDATASSERLRDLLESVREGPPTRPRRPRRRAPAVEALPAGLRAQRSLIGT